MAHQWVADGGGKKRQHRVLVIDDDAPTCILSNDILQRAGYKVSTAVRPEDAVASVQRGEQFDLAIVDIVMPTMNGDECARLLRAHDPDLPILFLTGFPEALFQARPLLWANEAFLEKPCSAKSLLEAVSLLLNGTLGEATETTGNPAVIRRTNPNEPSEPIS